MLWLRRLIGVGVLGFFGVFWVGLAVRFAFGEVPYPAAVGLVGLFAGMIFGGLLSRIPILNAPIAWFIPEWRLQRSEQSVRQASEAVEAPRVDEIRDQSAHATGSASPPATQSPKIMRLLVLLVALAAIGGAVWFAVDARRESDDLRAEVQELRSQARELESQLSTRPALGELIVVGKRLVFTEGSSIPSGACVSYRAFGSISETCLPILFEATAREASLALATAVMSCYSSAHIGR